MRNFERVKCTLLLLCTISAAFVSCDDFTRQNDTKTVGLEDPSVDATVKAALENGSVSEVVVRKDLLLFPVNAPNLVIAHSQEIHAVPQKNGSNSTDGKPVAAEVAEVNEYSLSQLVNDTDNDTTSQGVSIPASSFPNGPENDSVLEPGKLLEIVSGFNLSSGVATEKVPLPSEVQNFSLPKHSIVDLLSKSLPQADDAPMTNPSTEASSYYVGKRSIDDYSDADEGDDSQSNGSESTEDDDSQSNDTELEKRSVESDEDDSSDSKSDESSTTEESGSSSSTTTEIVKRSIDSGNDVDSSSTTEDGSSSTTESATSTDIVKRSIDSDEDDSTEESTLKTTTSTGSTKTKRSAEDSAEDDSKSDSTEESTLKTTTSTGSTKTKRSAEDDDDDDDDSSSSNTEYYDHVVSKSSEQTIGSHAESSSLQKSRKESLVRDSEDDMDVAEDIVFRPLFRYRQETRLRQRYPSYARSRNGNQYRYRADDSNYD